MPRGSLRVRGKVTNATQVGAELDRTKGALDDALDVALKHAADRSVEILQIHAPKGRTRQLERGIKARRRGARGIDVTVHAIAPETGYDYARVTRFGHTVEEIIPTEGRAALRVRFQGGDTAYFNRVRGFQPHGDWVDRALPSIELELDDAMREAGHVLELRLFS